MKEPSKRENYKSKSSSRLQKSSNKSPMGVTKHRTDAFQFSDAIGSLGRSEYQVPPECKTRNSDFVSSQSLYQLEPKTKSYQATAYKPNVYVDNDKDSMILKTRKDTSLRARTGMVNQPLIEMMTNVLDTIQLTSKHDYKRAKERGGMKEIARQELRRLHPD